MLFGNKNEPNAPSAAAPTDIGALIFDAGVDNFEADVINASMEMPVLVDFWAPWCGPCKQLMPTLEKVVNEAGGKIKMAKVNLDDNQQLAQMLRVQSVPTVFAFFQGQPIEAFQGNLPESQIKTFVDKVLEAARQAMPDALDIPEALKGAAAALAENDLQSAQAIYMQILQTDQKNADAFSGLIRVLLAAGQIEQAQSMMEQAPEDIQKTAAYKEVQTAVDLASNAPDGDAQEFLDALDKDENNHQARFDLALALFANGQKEEAADQLLVIIGKDREWNEEAARHQLLKFFEAMGHSDPVTMAARKKLSTILFS